MRRDLMATVLEPAARERCACIIRRLMRRRLVLFQRRLNSSHRIASWNTSNLFSLLVSRIALVGPERSGQIETILLRMVQSGQIRGKVSESQLINLLEQVRRRTFHTSLISKHLTNLLRWRIRREISRHKSQPLWYVHIFFLLIIHELQGLLPNT